MPVKIRAKRAGFRRCGIAHPAEWTEYPDDRFSKKELKRLEEETMLEVKFVGKGAEEPDDDSLESKTVAELTTMLEEKGVTDIPPKTRKADLIKMLEKV